MSSNVLEVVALPSDTKAELEAESDAPSDTRTTQETPTGFFDGDDTPRPEIVEGLIREGQLVAFAGPYGMGKSPILTDLTVHIIQGKAWCGRNVSQRPVI